MSSRLFTFGLVLLSIVDLASAKGCASREPQFPACSGFEVSANDTLTLPGQSQIISPGIVCSNSSSSCDVLSGGWPTLDNTFSLANGSAIAGQYEISYGIWDATCDSRPLFGGGYIGAVENETTTLMAGSSGYVVFEPIYRCIRGNIVDCPSDFDLANNTQVTVCYPTYAGNTVAFESIPGHFEPIPILAGQRYINETPVAVASNLTENPNNNPPYGLLSSDAPLGKMRTGPMAALTMAVFWLGVSMFVW